MQIFAVVVNRDDTVQVVSTNVVKETPQYFIIERTKDWRDPRSSAWGYSSRLLKERTHTSARAALEAYMVRRQCDKASAQSVIGQATKQIASANELLMHLPAEPVGDTVEG